MAIRREVEPSRTQTRCTPQDGFEAYPFLVIKTFPDGLRGLMIVSMVLAMMSSLDSVFNCVSTVCTTDLYVRFLDPGASARRQVWDTAARRGG